MLITKFQSFLLLMVAAASFSLLSCTDQEPVTPAAERDALIVLYNSTDGDNWVNKTGWLGAEGTECSWFGVTCINKRVYAITLPLNQLSGAIPKELGQLEELFNLKLNNNELTGSIPAELGELSHLNMLALSFNRLTGIIPTELGKLENLTVFGLSDNELAGNIPTGLGNLSKLTSLSLSKNQLTGEIPRELGQLTDLTLLALSQNKLSGVIPSELVSLKQVRQLYLYENCVKTDDLELKSFLAERDSKVGIKRRGCVKIEEEAGLR